MCIRDRSTLGQGSPETSSTDEDSTTNINVIEINKNVAKNEGSETDYDSLYYSFEYEGANSDWYPDESDYQVTEDILTMLRIEAQNGSKTFNGNTTLTTSIIQDYVGSATSEEVEIEVDKLKIQIDKGSSENEMISKVNIEKTTSIFKDYMEFTTSEEEDDTKQNENGSGITQNEISKDEKTSSIFKNYMESTTSEEEDDTQQNQSGSGMTPNSSEASINRTAIKNNDLDTKPNTDIDQTTLKQDDSTTSTSITNKEFFIDEEDIIMSLSLIHI